MHAAQIAVITMYITFGPPKMESLPTPMSRSKKRLVLMKNKFA